MDISGLQWSITLIFIVLLLAYDFIFHVRKAHEPTIREAAIWSAIYIGVALLFGVFILIVDGGTYAAEYYAGYITEKALSVDNLFVFLIIMASFKVPREDQQKVLLFGIVFAMLARAIFIFAGAALINTWSWLFYIFGIVLIYTAGNLIKDEISAENEEDEANNIVIRLAKKYFKTSEHYDGDKLFTIENGKKVMTPMLLVMVAIGGTDLLFALDSIPAIFGLTQSAYIVFTATAFSLMGLRQLYFLIDGLLDRLIYLSWGLSLILAFIGVKLVIHALHENTLPFINDGEPIHVVEVSIGVSLAVIVGVLLVTVLASLYSPKGQALAIIHKVTALSESYLALPEDASMKERAKIKDELERYAKKSRAIKQKYRDELIDSEQDYQDLVHRARGKHEDYIQN
ncbi:TerC family protein [Rothia sp. P7208]|uniref:TerC family protein n=1 Tax=Rothia sp. P7208 TaxID=3402660 RepID=UPI003AC044E5